ncbi:unnamed protein product [Penicillium salamii]|nr:unnamed protein product [Penicillium salamii]CAG8362392.1 unnamed protein product [Penicillium salamii]
MSDQHVTVTLVPLIDVANPPRSLLLNTAGNQLEVSIGRCSKREIRKRTPAADNAWYDSRVMSRDHCTLTINPDRRNAHVCDVGSTHGTFLNDGKLVTGLLTPLYDGDILRFGVNVDHGRDSFSAIEVRYKIDWPKHEVIVIADDPPVETVPFKATHGRSTNTFAVPDDDESEPEEDESVAGESSLVSGQDYQEDHSDHPSDDSKESVPRSWESGNLQPAETSPPSSVDKGEAQDQDVKPKAEGHLADPSLVTGVDKSEKKEPDVESNPEKMPAPAVIGLATVDQPGDNSSSILEPMGSKPVRPLILVSAPSEHNPLPNAQLQLFGPDGRSDAQLHPFGQDGRFSEACYDKIPEDTFSDWKIMKPIFMRLADMTWGESDHIPDVDYEKRIIHAARRCSLARDSYWVDDQASFQPQVGTEVPFTLTDEESDSSFHRMPGHNLRYWAVDKRRHWVIYEDQDGQEMDNWWWIVEKPWEILGDAIKEEISKESKVPDCHKCWIVRTWDPQMIGGIWLESPPYWDSGFNQIIFSDDESVDSDEEDWDCEYDEEHESLGNVDPVELPLCSLHEDYGTNRHEYFESEDDSDVSVDSESVSGSLDGDKDEELCVDSFASEHSWSSEISGGESESGECSDGSGDDGMGSITSPIYHAWDFTQPGMVSEEYMAEAGPSSFRNLIQKEPAKVDESLLDDHIIDSSVSLESSTRIKESFQGLKNPQSQFPEHAVSLKLPGSCQGNPRTFSFEPSAMSVGRVYHDGPFSINTNFSKPIATPLLSPPLTAGTIKRPASEMESSGLPESGTPQHTHGASLDAEIQTDPATISDEAKCAIASALAENTSAVTENDRPAKRAKSSHTPSTSLARHATTALVGALLGGLATVATLAALPNEYFA